MKPVLSVAEMRAVDERAQGTTSLHNLIARAGAAVAAEAVAMLAPRGGPYGARVVVVCGRGNNGNDGRVAAGILARRGAAVSVVSPDTPAGGGGVDLVIDAAYGTGFRGDYEAPGFGAPVLAVDVPTGVDADLGTASRGSVRAERTVTFGAYKPGLLLNQGPERAGRVTVRPIGLPVDDAGASIFVVEDEDLSAIPLRRRAGHKWSTAVMVVAGSPGMYGAPRYVADGAARAGAGMVRLGVPGAPLTALPAGEAVGVELPARGFEHDALDAAGRCKALALGPGLGTSSATSESVRRLVAGASIPTVVDADGLTALGEINEAAATIGRRDGSGPVVLTPHEAEFARLTGSPPGEDRIRAVRDLARRVGAVVLLKGATTVVADPAGRVLLATAGTTSLATAGSGDVLSGVIAALLARGLGGLEAAALGAYVHGLAARQGLSEGLIAGDLPLLVASVLSERLGGGRG